MGVLLLFGVHKLGSKMVSGSWSLNLRSVRGSDRETYGSPRFPLRGSFKGDMDTGMDIDVDIDVDLFGDLVSLLSNGPYRAYYGFLW